MNVRWFRALAFLGPFLGSAWLLGRRTAQLHVALASRDDDPVFAPEPVARMYQRSLYQSMRAQAAATLRRLTRIDAVGPDVEELLARQEELLARFSVVTGAPTTGAPVRAPTEAASDIWSTCPWPIRIRSARVMSAAGHIAEAFASQPYAYWVEHLRTLDGPWAPAQDPLEIARDPQLAANGVLRPVVDADGTERTLVANPVQFDETPPSVTRGPTFAEHTDEILRELGRTEDEILHLKIDGACT